MKTYATLGPACCRAELLTDLLGLGLTGFRLNLSHTTLAACRPWTDAVQAARQASGRDAELIIDMRGPELRMGPLSRPVTLTAGERVTLGPGGLPVEPDILAAIRPGREILLDDGLMALRAESCGRAVTCTVTRGGVLESRKSITLPRGGASPPGPDGPGPAGPGQRGRAGGHGGDAALCPQPP